MVSPAHTRAVRNYRSRLTGRGLVRFEVMAGEHDRDLIRALARRMAEGGPDADDIRATIRKAVEGEAAPAGGILAALRRSPLVDADLDLDLERPREHGRPVEL